MSTSYALGNCIIIAFKWFIFLILIFTIAFQIIALQQSVCLYISHKIHMLKSYPHPRVMVLGGGTFGWWWGHKGGALTSGIRALIKGIPESSYALFLLWEVTRSWQSVTQKRALSPEPNHAHTLILNFPPLELWKINDYCFLLLLFLSFIITQMNLSHL